MKKLNIIQIEAIKGGDCVQQALTVAAGLFVLVGGAATANVFAVWAGATTAFNGGYGLASTGCLSSSSGNGSGYGSGSGSGTNTGGGSGSGTGYKGK